MQCTRYSPWVNSNFCTRWVLQMLIVDWSISVPPIVWRDNPSFVTSHPGTQRVQEEFFLRERPSLPGWGGWIGFEPEGGLVSESIRLLVLNICSFTNGFIKAVIKGQRKMSCFHLLDRPILLPNQTFFCLKSEWKKKKNYWSIDPHCYRPVSGNTTFFLPKHREEFY